MAEVKPPAEPSPGPTAAEGCLMAAGGLTGLADGVVLSLGGYWAAGALPGGRCAAGVGVGVGLLAVAAGAGFVAWRLVSRRGGGPALAFLRGLSVTLAAFLLIPWPCSYSWAGFFAALSACTPH